MEKPAVSIFTSPLPRRGRFPPWLHRSLVKGDDKACTQEAITKNNIHTVCQEAKCPNLSECFSKKHASFLAMGSFCTRSCGFCAVKYAKTPPPLDPSEPDNIATTVESLALSYAVITQVTRDDLSDGGAHHMASIVRAIQKRASATKIEVLTSDFNGNEEALHTVLEASPHIFNHNVETVERISSQVRNTASFTRSLHLLKTAKESGKTLYTKSGLMVGLGETQEEVIEAMHSLRAASCDILTIGQYLQPHPHKLPVKAFIHPDQFKEYERIARSLGFHHVHAAPFVRSSYTGFPEGQYNGMV